MATASKIKTINNATSLYYLSKAIKPRVKHLLVTQTLNTIDRKYVVIWLADEKGNKLQEKPHCVAYSHSVDRVLNKLGYEISLERRRASTTQRPLVGEAKQDYRWERSRHNARTSQKVREAGNTLEAENRPIEAEKDECGYGTWESPGD